jgi:LacI family transcriptional regulator
MNENVTIFDIAAKAKCSISTVSRALNNMGRVSAKTRARIFSIAEELHYRPNTAARSLAMSRSLTIGLVISDITNMFYAEMADIIQKEAYQLGYCVIIVCTDNKPNLNRHYVDFLIARGVDGIIFGSARYRDPVIDELKKRNFPMIILNRRIKKDNVSCVTIDHIKGAVMLMEHLIDRGYRRIAFVSGPLQFSPVIDRLEGYTRALTAHGLPVDETLIVRETAYSREAGKRGAVKLLTGPNRPDAIFAANDHVALGVLEGLSELNLSVPRDIAVAGFDDIGLAALKFVNLTTVSQRLEETAREAVKILIDSIGSNQPGAIRKIVIDPVLKIRGSCGENLPAPAVTA